MSGSQAPAAPVGPDDRALLEAHVAGDPNAFTILVERHRDRLWAVALRTLGEREEAADALQDALLSAFRSAGSFRGDAAVTTWLHRIVVNACLDRVRRRAARPSVPLGERDVAWPSDPQGQVDTRLTVRAALADLPPEQREALVLVDMEDLPVSRAAELLGVPEGTVKSRCSRGRTALAARLRADPPEPEPGPGNLAGPSNVASAGGGTGHDPPHAGGARDEEWWR